MPIAKYFVEVDGRLVHYRAAGEGAPVVLLHDSVKSSSALVPLMKRLAPHFRVFALDTPGYGNSDPLPGSPAMPDFARSVRMTLDALGLDRVCIYGRHTSSKIVLELLLDCPERFDVAIMDGLSLSRSAYPADYVARYLPPFEVEDSGAHLARLMMQVSDIQRWFPWFKTQGTTRMNTSIRDGEEGSDFLLDFLMAGANYSGAYGAAMGYEGMTRLDRLDPAAPAVFMAAQDDVLHPYLDQVPAHFHVERVAAGTENIYAQVERLFRERSSGAACPALAKQPGSRSYVHMDHGAVHLREAGQGSGPATLFLHELPGGTAGDSDLIAALAGHGRVIAPDLPGGGESDPLPRPDLDAYCDLLARIVAASGESRVNVVATMTSTPLAVAFAERHPALVRALVLDGMVPTGAEVAAGFCPPIAFDTSGAHLQKVWHMLRNQAVQWPWYSLARDGIRRIDPDLRGERLQARLVDLIKQQASYGEAATAALQYDAAAALRALDVPTLVLADAGDPACPVPEGGPAHLSTAARETSIEARGARIADYLAGL